MKKLLFAMFMLFVGTALFAQEKAAAPPAKSKMSMHKMTPEAAGYACPKCYAMSKSGGQCEHCKIDKVKMGDYYCKACAKGCGKKAGKCPSCKGATVKMTKKECEANMSKMVD